MIFLYSMILQEVPHSSRKSIGDVFGSRTTQRNSPIIKTMTGSVDASKKIIGSKENDLDDSKNKFMDMLSNKEFSSRSPLKHTLSSDHPSLIRSATWMEVLLNSSSILNEYLKLSISRNLNVADSQLRILFKRMSQKSQKMRL